MQLVVLIRSEACDYSDSLLAALPHLIQVPAAAVDAYVCFFKNQIIQLDHTWPVYCAGAVEVLCSVI